MTVPANCDMELSCGGFESWTTRVADLNSTGTKRLIDEAYMNGVSIAYGSPRKHAWSNAVCWS